MTLATTVKTGLSPLPLAGEGGAKRRERAMANRKILGYAKRLRRDMTDAEWRLWYHLRAHRFLGLKFKRQKPAGPYIVDFVCYEQRLVIEIDGGQHTESQAYDMRRDAFLRRRGFKVLRFWNNDVLGDTAGVLQAIRNATLSPVPSPASGRGE